MTTVEIEADVPESRQVTITLPPGVPSGRVRLTVTVADPGPAPVTYYRPTDPAVAAQFDAFLRMLPGLRTSHGGHYVAVSGGAVVASGLYLDGVDKLARQAVGPDAAVYHGWVEPSGWTGFRSGKLVEVREAPPG
jgi:hypothetical protein